jgi:hypothetical protein
VNAIKWPLETLRSPLSSEEKKNTANKVQTPKHCSFSSDVGVYCGRNRAIAARIE